MNKWTTDQIENLPEEEAKAMSEETLAIKEHSIYFVTLDDGYYGYSALVYKNSRQIYYANDYSGRHLKGTAKEELKKMYIEGMTNKLFTEEEIKAPLADYGEYTRKRYFLMNYYHMREEHISCFGNFSDPEFVKEYKGKTKDMILNPYSFCKMSKDKEAFIRHQGELVEALEKRFEETVNDYQYQKNAFLQEMRDHEYHINWQADFDTLSAFGNISWHEDDIDAYFKELGFNEVQKKAYMAARKQVLRKAG